MQILLAYQSIALPPGRRYQARYNLVFYGFISSLVLAISIGGRQGFDILEALLDPHAAPRTHVIAALLTAQIAAALATTIAFGTFRRRPDVYLDDVKVDRQRTTSILSRITFSWNKGIFDVSKERQMQLDDLPALDWKTRSKHLYSEFFVKRGSTRRPLWWQLIRVHIKGIVYQWAFMLFNSCFTVIPQFVFYKFLSEMEKRETASTAWLMVWVAALFLDEVVETFSYAGGIWVTLTKLEIPVTSMLQGLIFTKALRLYESTSPPLEDSKEDEGGKDSAAKARDEEEKKKKEEEKRRREEEKLNSKQSVMNHMKIDT